jgi:hypothetical protein
MPYKISFSTVTTKMPFLSSLLISLYYEAVNRASYTKTDISIYRDCLIGMPMELVDIPVKLTDIPMEVI